MKPRVWIVAVVVWVGLVAALYSQGTGSILNLRGRTDDNSSLIVSSLAYSGTDSALQNFANMRVKTDTNGYLITTFGASGAGTSGPSGIATTSTDGFVLANSTAATAAIPVQQSPRLRFRSNVWNTTVTAVNNTDDWWIESVPVSGTTPSGLLKFGKSLNGGATTYPFTIDSAGNTSTALSISYAGNINGGAASLVSWSGTTRLGAPLVGQLNVVNTGQTSGAALNVSALPTVGSGFGTSPAVIAGSTPFAGSVNVGTVAPGTTGTITFGGTAFPSTPHCIANNTITAQVVKATPTTTQLVLTSAGFTASDIVDWICISSK